MLATAFSSAVWVVYFHLGNHQAMHATWLIFWVNFLWTLLYDTQYAMGDYEDDRKLPLHSSVTFFQQYTQVFNGLLMALLIGLLGAIALPFGWSSLLVLFLTALLFGWQWFVLQTNVWAEHALKVFLSHMYVGLMWTTWLTLQYI